MLKLSASILSADFAKLGEEVRNVSDAGVDMIHIDVMDGLFVPSLSFGIPVIHSIRRTTDKIFDVHLMIEEPDRYIEDFAFAGADLITVHVEACRHLESTIQKIRSYGKKVGVALNPATPLSMLDYVLNKIDMVLIMSVNPGFGGQEYIRETTRKLKELRTIINRRGLDVDIEVDGGVKLSNVREVIAAEANVIVAGTSIFEGNKVKNVREFRLIFEEFGNDIPMDFRVDINAI